MTTRVVLSDSPRALAEAPGNHHRERGGDGGCRPDPGGLHAPLLTDALHRGPSLPLRGLRTPHRLPPVRWPGGQSLAELNSYLKPPIKKRFQLKAILISRSRGVATYFSTT